MDSPGPLLQVVILSYGIIRWCIYSITHLYILIPYQQERLVVIVLTSPLLELTRRLKPRALAAIFQSMAPRNVMSIITGPKKTGLLWIGMHFQRELQVEAVLVPAWKCLNYIFVLGRDWMPTPFPIRFWLCRSQAQNLGVASLFSQSFRPQRLILLTVQILALLPQPSRGPRLILRTLRIWLSALCAEPPPLRQTASSTNDSQGQIDSHVPILPFFGAPIMAWPIRHVRVHLAYAFSEGVFWLDSGDPRIWSSSVTPQPASRP